MKILPEIGQPVSESEMVELLDFYEKWDIIRYLSEHGYPEKDFVSDGCSMWPDSWLGKDIFPACFWHDVRYWCGTKGDELARLFADVELAKDVAVLASPQLARTMFIGVGFGGTEHVDTPFKWGYGRE